MSSVKKNNFVSKAQMVSNIKQRLKEEFNIKLTREQIQKVLEIEQDEIECIITLEKSYKYSWGIIKGIQKIPKKIYGYMTFFEGSIANKGYSSWKRGYPKVEFDKKMKYCQEYSPEVYFNTEPIKFGSEARQFRK